MTSIVMASMVAVITAMFVSRLEVDLLLGTFAEKLAQYEEEKTEGSPPGPGVPGPSLEEGEGRGGGPDPWGGREIWQEGVP